MYTRRRVSLFVALTAATLTAESLAALQQQAGTPTAGPGLSLPADPEARANWLKDLRDRGVITQEEFMEQLSRL